MQEFIARLTLRLEHRENTYWCCQEFCPSMWQVSKGIFTSFTKAFSKGLQHHGADSALVGWAAVNSSRFRCREAGKAVSNSSLIARGECPFSGTQPVQFIEIKWFDILQKNSFWALLTEVATWFDWIYATIGLLKWIKHFRTECKHRVLKQIRGIC